MATIELMPRQTMERALRYLWECECGDPKANSYVIMAIRRLELRLRQPD